MTKFITTVNATAAATQKANQLSKNKYMDFTDFIEQGYQNLFSANHRNGMIERYGYTQAMTVTVEELMQQGKA